RNIITGCALSRLRFATIGCAPWLTVIVIVSTSAAFAQAPKPAAQVKPAAKAAPVDRAWSPPRTPWGDPDIQGVWNDATSTPLERPDRVGAKTVLSDEEAGEFQQELANQLSRDRRDGPAEADVARA